MVCTAVGWFFLLVAALCGGEHAAAEKIEAGPAVHITLDELETVDVPFDRPGAPRFAQGGMDSIIVLPQAGCEAFEVTASGIIGPLLPQLSVSPVAIGLAIASGSLFAVQVNSNFFWMFKALLGLSTTGALKTLTVVTSIASVVSLPLVILASFVL